MKREATRSIGAVLADYIQEAQLSEGLQQTRIYSAWDALTLGGVPLRDYTARHTFRDGVLTCRMRSSVVRQHLQFQAEALRLQLNAALGSDIVKQVKVL